jgi:hypothetical protein
VWVAVMPVNSNHPDYDANLAAWSRARAVIAGEDALKAAGERLLPRLDAQTDEEFELWQREEKSKRTKHHDWKLVETRTPLRLGKPLPLIPFVFHGPRHSQPDVEKLPLTDISRDTMTELFRRGEVLPEGRSMAEEERLIAADQVTASLANSKGK